MEVLEKIDELRRERGWSKNNLAMEAMITQSTINNLYARKSDPKIETLKAICDAFGITLSQFFLEDEQMEILTNEEKDLVCEFRKLSKEKQNALIKLLK